MKIQLLSDLHLEAHPHFQPEPAADADLLVLAGDIGSYQSGSQLADEDFGLARFSPRHGWPVPVVYVPGNHEYDQMDFEDAHARLQASCARLGIHWLERKVLPLREVLGPQAPAVRLVGTTLWSDFDALVPEDVGLTQQLQARDKAMRAANFYLRKTGGTRDGQPLLAVQVRALSLQCQAWLRAALAQPFDGDTVVITHFAPSLRSADPRYGLVPGTAGFCNALDDLLPQARLWLHGHLHCPVDYTHLGCRVLANPLGYARKGEQQGFVPQCVVAVPPPQAGAAIRRFDAGQ